MVIKTPANPEPCVRSKCQYNLAKSPMGTSPPTSCHRYKGKKWTDIWYLASNQKHINPKCMSKCYDSVLRNDRKHKYIFSSPKINFAWQTPIFTMPNTVPGVKHLQSGSRMGPGKSWCCSQGPTCSRCPGTVPVASGPPSTQRWRRLRWKRWSTVPASPPTSRPPWWVGMVGSLVGRCRGRRWTWQWEESRINGGSLL